MHCLWNNCYIVHCLCILFCSFPDCHVNCYSLVLSISLCYNVIVLLRSPELWSVRLYCLLCGPEKGKLSKI
uniref:Uncharacterized protein n=1 Tax=Arundo donax TaxID=35708 RepID=A0A0A8ZI91_ARUDO